MQRTWPSYLDLRSQVKVKGFTLEFRVRSISWTLWSIFMKLHSYVPLSKLVCRAHHQLPKLKDKVTGQGQRIYPWILCPLLMISPEPFDWFSWCFTHMFLLVRRCAEHMTQLPRLKVTGQGQRIYLWISCPFQLRRFSPKYSSDWDNVQNLWLGYTDSRSRSQFKVMCDLPFNLCPLHIWPYRLNRFINLFHYTSFKCFS